MSSGFRIVIIGANQPGNLLEVSPPGGQNVDSFPGCSSYRELPWEAVRSDQRSFSPSSLPQWPHRSDPSLSGTSGHPRTRWHFPAPLRNPRVWSKRDRRMTRRHICRSGDRRHRDQAAGGEHAHQQRLTPSHRRLPALKPGHTIPTARVAVTSPVSRRCAHQSLGTSSARRRRRGLGRGVRPTIADLVPAPRHEVPLLCSCSLA